MNGQAIASGFTRPDARRQLVEMTSSLAIIQLQYPKEAGEDVRAMLKLISDLYNRLEVPPLPEKPK